jgi:hypothetical protein
MIVNARNRKPAVRVEFLEGREMQSGFSQMNGIMTSIQPTVMLNPQPLPPDQGAILPRVAMIDARMLNPQPLPP